MTSNLSGSGHSQTAVGVEQGLGLGFEALYPVRRGADGQQARFCGLLESFYDTSWKLNDVVKVG